MQACRQLHKHICSHTKAKLLSRKLPFGVIWQLCGVNIYVVVAMDTFNHLPLYLELGFLFEKKKKDIEVKKSGSCLLITFLFIFYN